MNHRPLFQRLLIAVLGLFAAVFVVGSPLVTHPVHAIPVEVVTNVPDQTNDVLDEIFHALAQAAVTAFFNAARTFAGQIAYDAANYLASGGTGQGALAFEDGFGAYLENVGQDAAGEFIGSLSADFFQEAGFDLCRPPNPSQLLNLQISISNTVPGLEGLCPEGQDCTNRPRPRCDFQQIISNYENLYTTLSNAEITDFVTTSFGTNSSELGISSSIFGRSAFNITNEIKKATQEREEGDGFKPVEGKVDEKIKTPANLVKEQTTEEIVEKPSQSESDAFLATMGTAFEQGFSQLASYTASMFINTLANKLLQRVFERGIIGAFNFTTAQVGISPDQISVRSKTDARKANVDLKNVTLLRVSDIEISGELIACPENRGLWNCTADETLAQLIQGKTAEGNPTIRLAIDRDWLKGDWELVPTSNVPRNQDRNCYKQAYCAGNLQKLRAMRILPVGFEFAANSVENVDRCAGAGGCVKLREVVEGFSNCNTAGRRDAEHPWCNLIDPNWVITSFQQQCQLTGFGDTLISNRLGQRREECRDIQTCLRRNDRGDCVGGYGFCVADKTVYRFNANECQEDFASCRSFTTRAGQTVSYLRNTLDYSVCRAENVGCLSYATARGVFTGEGTWTADLTGSDADNVAVVDSFGSISFNIDAGQSASNFATVYNPSVSGLDSPGSANLNFYVDLPALTASSVTLFLGSDSAVTPATKANYYAYTATAQSGGKPFIAGRNIISVPRTAGIRVGSPNNLSLSYAELRISYPSIYSSQTGVGLVGGGWRDDLNKVYFDKTLEPCASSDEGCTRLLSVEVGTSALNVIRNPSFETTGGTPLALDNWRAGGAYAAPTVAAGTAALDGSVATDASNSLRQDVDMIPLRLYTVSGWVRANGGSPSATITVRQMQSFPGAAPVESLPAELADAFKSSGCTATNQPQISTEGRVIDNNWSRFECSFLSVASTRYAVIEIDGRNALVDAVQLEEGQFATAFLTGSNRALPVLHMKVAPDDLRCTGAATDPAACNAFAKVCRQVDAGCQGYTDKLGGPEVPAILTSNDVCPNECVGYAEFRKQPAAFDLVNDPDTRFSDPTDATSSYFIPTTALQCTQEQVGCEAFTNVAAAAAGGEQASYWSYLRACRLPSATLSKTFFTWEGSESAGFQLRTFSLISESGVPNPGPETLSKRGPDGAFKEPSSCNEGLWRTGIDPDCRQFYDRDGNVFYRFYSQTILSSTDCVNLRISRSTSIDDCSKTGGDFSAATGECLYNAFLGESRTCPATAASCRAYSGAAAGNVQVLVNENFRTGIGRFSAGTPSPESLLVGDQSLRIDNTTPSVRTEVSFASEPAGLYRVSFWAKAAGRNDMDLTFGIRNADTPAATPVQVGNIRLSTDWQRYTIGLFSGANGAVTSTLITTMGGPAVPRAVFIDEVRIERIRDTAFVIQNSWNTPISCDRSFAGAIEPQAMLGCRAYSDRFNRDVNAFRFTRLCRTEGIGCRAFVDTRNSESPYSESFNMSDVTPVPVFNAATPVYGASTTTRLGDRMKYLVYDPTKVCQRENASCTAFGKPLYSIDRTSIESYTSVYYKDDITKYGEALCRPSEEMCEEYKFGGANDYFRDPQRKLCELRQGVRLSSADFPSAPAGSVLDSLPEAEYDGWFIQGSSPATPCYPDSLEGGRFFPMPKRGDPNWSGWTGLCPGTSAECTEFRDINDTSDVLHRAGKPYFFVADDRLDRTSCQGNVDVGQGCVLMRDMSDPVLKYSVAASYRKYADNDFRPTQPVDCFRNPTDPSCTATASTSSDANLLLKIKIDRDCAQWLGCKSSESVFDAATSQYKEICTNVALCDKSTDRPGEIFCANYVDRSATSTEAVMQRGKFFDIDAYTERPVGLGEKDYSGYALPDTFQIPELVTARVGSDGANNVENNKYRFALDYRLAASVQMPTEPRLVGGVTVGLQFRANPGANFARPLAITPTGAPIQLANPGIKLCEHVGTGIIGYFLATDVSSLGFPLKPIVNCYLPVKSGGDNSNFQNVSTRFSLDDPRTDPTLTNAFPPAECRVNPEADSPFDAKYVTEWDLTTNPPKAVSKVGGFSSANTCEFGEDCVCNYKRANYGSVAFSKFFGPFAQNVPPGICQGGPRDGQACLPSTIFQIQTQGGRTTTGAGSGSTEGQEVRELVQGVEGSNASQTCGAPEGGGRCVAFNKLEIIKGVFGQCLERDETRVIGEDQANKPCLTWNPTPILFGDKDSFHYQPTSGYLPPQNSGQYYCVSPVKKPTKTKLIWNSFSQYDSPHTGGDGTNEVKPANMYRAGDDDWDHTQDNLIDSNRRARLRFFAGWQTRNDFADDWVSADNNGILGEDQNYFASIFGAKPDSYYTGTTDCELADDDQDDDGSFDEISGGANENDAYGIRLVDAGNGYGEYFLRSNDDNLAAQLQVLGVPPHDGGGPYIHTDSDATKLARTAFFETSLSDNTISYFKIDPLVGPHGRIACGYQAAWVDNLGSVNYDDAGSNRPKDTEWRDKFYENYNPYLTRGQEGIYSTKGINGRPFQVDCVGRNPDPDENKCYIKYWELDYRSTNQKKFVGLQRTGQDGTPVDIIVRNFDDIRIDPIQSTCENSKPYFAVRAVFEARASNTTATGPDLTKDTVNGPWRFVGYWVSACGGDTGGDQRWIYMNMEVGTASVCRELAEVRSKNSNQDAAFTDRVWRRGDFREPGTGLQYTDSASPFSSAINTGPAGHDPLFMSGSEIAGFSPLNPPTWLAPPSQTYFRPGTVPKDKWAYLSNLFARIYRVYRFQFLPVSKTDRACTDGPFKGTRCTTVQRCSNDVNQACPTVGSATGCTAGGTCIVTAPACTYDGSCRLPLSEDENIAQKVCLGGISRLLSCAESADVCKAATFAKDDGTIKSLLNVCAPNTGWTEVLGRPGFWTNGGPERSTEQAGREGAFGCQINIGPNVNTNCAAPEAASFDCPVRIEGRTCSTGASGDKKCDLGTQTIGSGVGQIDLDEAGMSPAEFRNTCGNNDDCNFNPLTPIPNNCGVPDAGWLGRCVGGVRDTQICFLSAGGIGREMPRSGTYGSCEVDVPVAGAETNAQDSCVLVSTPSPEFRPIGACLLPTAGGVATPNTSDDPDNDNNMCTHSGGYQPRIDICPNPADEYCGLIAYRIAGTGSTASLNPSGASPLPTDHTLGMYTPTRLGFSGLGVGAATFRYMAYYNPQPPRLAAPDTRNCAIPGQCPISRVDAFAFNGQTDGVINVGGGSHKSTMRFYAWAAHNQMPLRQVVIDWGDNTSQRVDDTRMKNRKPFCGVQRECSNTPGLTCQTNADCPPAAGTCVAIGTCSQNPQITCSQDANCTVGGVTDTCSIRTMFGNSTEACQSDYYDFAHLYSCSAQERENLPSCTFPSFTTAPPRCSRDPNRTCLTPGSNAGCAPGDICLEGLAPVGGCFDREFQTCRYTPRVMIQDNFGWCTGECRNGLTGGQPDDLTTNTVKHPNGGCWAGQTLGNDVPNIRFNTSAGNANSTGNTVLNRDTEECRENLPLPTDPSAAPNPLRPWIVYPGSLQLRQSGELAP